MRKFIYCYQREKYTE